MSKDKTNNKIPCVAAFEQPKRPTTEELILLLDALRYVAKLSAIADGAARGSPQTNSINAPTSVR